MKKVLNWTIGSFFRTFGRILAFVLLGSLFALLVYKSGIKITDLFGIARVYADETFSYSSSLWSYTNSNPQTDCNAQLRNCSINGYSSNIHLDTATNANYINTIRFYTYATDTNKFKSSNYYNFKFKVCQTDKDFTDIKSRGRAYAWGYNTTNAATGSTAGDPTEFSFKIDDIIEDNSCYYITFSAKPPVDSRYIGFWFSYTGYGDDTNLAVIPDVTYFNNTGGSINVKSLTVTYSSDVNATINNSTNQIINNQNENTQQIIDSQNQINDNITDSDITNASSDASSLFNNFTYNSHGLTAVIQAPLNFIRSLTSSTCSFLHLPIPFVNEYLDLPCLLPIYQDNFGAFLTIYQLIISGFIGYRIAVSIFFMVKGFKDPDSDKIEVIDL